MLVPRTACGLFVLCCVLRPVVLAFIPPPSGLQTPATNSSYKYLNPHSRYISMYHSNATGYSVWKVPANIDYRVLANVLPSIQNLDYCGASWAFAAQEAIQAASSLSQGTTAFPLEPLLSVQQLIDCTPAYDVCGSGWTLDAFETAAELSWLADAESYPYNGANPNFVKGNCRTQISYSNINVAFFELTSTSLNQPSLALALAVANQPVAVNIRGASVESFVNYQSGIYSDEGCFSEPAPDHTVLVVGYSMAGGSTPYWIIRNRWGPTWGMSGYMYMASESSSGSGICGIYASPGLYPIVQSAPCEGEMQPCGGGTCVRAGNHAFTCKCPAGFYTVTNVDGSEACDVDNLCTTLPYNPCGSGTCVYSSPGSYSCICPYNYISSISSLTGQSTCFQVLGNGDGPRYYTIQKGDTCFLIYAQFGLTFDEFSTMNPNINCSAPTLPVGVLVNVTNTLTCAEYYSVEVGDDCQTIEAKFGLSSAELFELNPYIQCFFTDSNQVIQPGQQVCVKEGEPVLVSPFDCLFYYPPQPQTCAQIAAENGASVKEVVDYNPKVNCSELVPADTPVCVQLWLGSSNPSSNECKNRCPFKPQHPHWCGKQFAVPKTDSCPDLFNLCHGNGTIYELLNRSYCSGNVPSVICIPGNNWKNKESKTKPFKRA